MKSFLVFLRILIVGCLWGIVFTEGIRVIMLCNWHFDIFWPDHWHQFNRMWQAGWKPHAAKEWALILLIVTFIPMLITGWWTLSLVEWERLIWNIISYPYELYQRYLGKSPVTAVTTNNRYGVVKRKSYKQIRPAGISTLRVPISDYGNTAISAPMSTPMSTSTSSAFAGSSYAPAYSSTPIPATAPIKKKTDVAATIDHALFKFDDDDDDFDLDIDSFEKTDINKRKQTAPVKSAKKFDDEDDEPVRKTSKKSYDFDEDDEDESPRTKRRETKDTKESKESKRNAKKTEDKEKTPRAQSDDSDERTEKPKRSTRASADKTEKSSEETVGVRGPVYDTLQQKGYDILKNVSVGSTVIDFVGISENDICVCLVDKESGDWLADEEMFNGEEPLWFSENSHRVSPVCKLNSAKKVIEEKLEEEGFEQNLSFYVIIQMANIINADDMFEIWDNMNIEVTRINRGAPKEIKLFSKQLNDAGEKTTKKNVEKLRNIFKNLK